MTSTSSKGSCDPGFTLIEVIGAFLIFAVALLMVIQLSGSMGVQMENAAINAELVTLARERLDSLEAVDFDSLSPGQGSDTVSVRGRTYVRSWTVSQYGPLLLQIDVSLEPDSTDGGPDFSASSFKADAW